MKKEEQERRDAIKRDALDFPNKTRNMILAGLFATTAMMAYAYSSGVVRIQDNTQREEYEGEEEEEN
jgi:hypothetical protein